MFDGARLCAIELGRSAEDFCAALSPGRPLSAPIHPPAAAMVAAPNRTFGTADLPFARAFDVEAQTLEPVFDKLFDDYFAKPPSGQGGNAAAAGGGRKHEPYVLFVLNPNKPAVARGHPHPQPS